MQGLQKLVSEQFQKVLSQHQFSPDRIDLIRSQIGKSLLESLQFIFSFYEDMNTFNESMIDELGKQINEAKLNEILLHHELSSLSKNMPEKGKGGQNNQQALKLLQITRQKIEEISKAINIENNFKQTQLLTKQKAQYEDQLNKDQMQIHQLKQDMRQLKSDYQKQVNQMKRRNKESKQLQSKAFISDFKDALSKKHQQQKERFSQLYLQERERTIKSQQSISTLTKYISQLMKFDEIYLPEEGIEKWISILKAQVEKYRRQIQISTGKRNIWQEKNPLKQLLNHHSNKLIYRKYRLAG